jgi:hypothetical protein
VNVDFFERLGREVGDRWRAKHHDAEAFPEVATCALEEMPPHEHVRPADIVSSLFGGERIRQANIAAGFGEPPVTVFSADRFYIEALFWLDGTTSIHQHGFSGAFHVLHGSSIHGEYRFTWADRINERVGLGHVALNEIELLRAGQTRTIRSGGSFIHSLFHLERPSVTIVVRTVSDLCAGPQYDYLKPCLAFDPHVAPPREISALSLLLFLRDAKPEAFWELLSALLRDADFETAARLLHHAHGVIEEEEFSRFADAAKRLQASQRSFLESVFAEQVRQRNITLRRREIRDPDHRFFLALLLNVPNRRLILDLIEARYPGRAASDVVVGMIRELSRTKIANAAEPNVIGLSTGDGDDFDEPSLGVVRQLLEGATLREAERAMRELHDEEIDADDIAAFESALAATRLLGPLFRRT